MKRTLLIGLIALNLNACKKADPNAGKTKIEYKYTADVSDTYGISYLDENNDPQYIIFTGTSYDKVIYTNRAMGFKFAQLTITTTTLPTYTIHGSASIYCNGKVSQDNETLSNGNGGSFMVTFPLFN